MWAPGHRRGKQAAPAPGIHSASARRRPTRGRNPPRALKPAAAAAASRCSRTAASAEIAARSLSAATLAGIKNCPELRDASRLSAGNTRYEERRRSCTRRDVGQAISLHATARQRVAHPPAACSAPGDRNSCVKSVRGNKLPRTLVDCWISPQRALSGGFRTRATQRNLSGTRGRRKAELRSSCVAANTPAKAASAQPTQEIALNAYASGSSTSSARDKDRGRCERRGERGMHGHALR